LIGVGFFFREIDVGFDVFGERREFVVRVHLILGALTITQYGLRGFLIAPEIGIGHARFEGFQALAMLGGVKDNSAQA
jgi:hypothetical protein